MVCAPAGYGKTVIISEWAQTRKHQVGWISLDEADDDPIRFFSYLKEAFKGQGFSLEDVEDYLSSYPMNPMDTLLILLLNALTENGKPVMLVLDDYHRIKNPEIHHILEFLIQRLPQNIHLVISTRIAPPIALDRFRIQSLIKEIRQDQLSFTEEEISLFLNQIIGLDLSKPEVVNLAKRTEGWIAGIHIAALILKNNRYSEDFIEKFSGSHSYIMDFLVKEAYFNQSEQVRFFLLESSILDDFCVELCDAVTLRNDGYSVLEKLVADNLFIVQLDDQRQWYRYHHLFSDVLRNLLQQTIPHHISKLCNRASDWYQQNGLMEEAVRFAFKGDNPARAADLIENYTLTAIKQGERNTLRGWLEKLSEETIRSRPVLCLLHAFTIMNDKTAASDELFCLRLQTAEDLIAEKEDKKDLKIGSFTFTDILKTTALLKAIFAFERGNPSETFLHDLQESLDKSSLSENEHAGTVLYLMGHIQLRTMDYQAAYHSFDDAFSVTKAKGNLYLTIYTTYLKAWILYQRGKYHQALHLCESTLNDLLPSANGKRRYFPLINALNVIIGSVYLEWNRLEEAEENLNLALNSLRLSTEIGILSNCIFRLLNVKFALEKDSDEIKTVVTDLEMMGQYHKTVIPLAKAQQMKLSSRLGTNPLELTDGEKMMELLSVDPGEFDSELTYYQDYEWRLMRRLIIIRLYLNQLKTTKKSLEEQLELSISSFLQHHLMGTEKLGLICLRIEVLITTALMSEINKNGENTLSILKLALDLASRENALRPFLDLESIMSEPLNHLLNRGLYVTFLNRILPQERPAKERLVSGRDTAPSQRDSQIESLSERELEVLRLIADGHSNQGISTELFISLNTVKSHITSIYSKLGVHKRTQAVSRANEVGLL